MARTYCWMMARNAVVSLPRWRSLSLLLTPLHHLHRRRINQSERILSIKGRKFYTKAAKRKEFNNALDEKDLSHILWWQEKLQMCRKPSSFSLVKRLIYSNLLGLDTNLKNGSLKEGNLNWEMLQFKSRFPREVLLCRVGDFYEAIGFDACILVEYAGLNPFGGLRSDSIPKAGCPIMNLRQTLDDLTRHGFSVVSIMTYECIVEEVQGPTQARARKSRFISGHAHPGSPYVFGLVEGDRDLDFPEPMPVVGISRSAKGYCILSVLETMKTYSQEDGLTEEALVTKLRTCQWHHLFLHSSLKCNSSGTCRWGEFGEGGLLWGECNSRHFEWFEGNPVSDLLSKVKELYGLDPDVTFRNVTVPSENRPRPLYLGTATQIGAIPNEGIPSLLKVLFPSNCSGLPVLYVRDLLLNPPPYEVALTIQGEILLLPSCDHCNPGFGTNSEQFFDIYGVAGVCLKNMQAYEQGDMPHSRVHLRSFGKGALYPYYHVFLVDVVMSAIFGRVLENILVKLLELREANHIEFSKIKSILDEIIQMYASSVLNEILKLLMDPTWVATGLKIEFETLVSLCLLVTF
ncbi:hypothetical protein M9H77_35773 [Catharanthus roseus]|uniref:Uncharacterized protein n=1 Tax=Catharanthus roseus TaxID=4058 RepID=A0ACB9ZQQ2_CATRO|nr:hypothetical protein M9H77_35773 [Catharanthus roseus]